MGNMFELVEEPKPEKGYADVTPKPAEPDPEVIDYDELPVAPPAEEAENL